MEKQLKAKNISFRYDPDSLWILKDMNLSVSCGERVALVGPSGCGKSTLSKILAGYIKPEKGKVLFDEKLLAAKEYCPVQMIHQHPEFSVNPRWKMSKVLNESWCPDDDLLKLLGIEKEWLNRWPIELSGGELQRFCIARVLGPKTKFLICDEISTMLDVITQAQMWEILLDVSKKNNMGMIVVTHNMALAKKTCDRIISLPLFS